MFGLKLLKDKLSKIFQGSAKADPNTVIVPVKDIINLFFDDETLKTHQENNFNSMDIARNAFDLMKQLSCANPNSNPSSYEHVHYNNGLDALKDSLPINSDAIDSTVIIDRETMERLYDSLPIMEHALGYLNNMKGVTVIYTSPFENNLRGESYASACEKLKYFDQNLRNFLYQHSISSYQHKADMAEQQRIAEDQYRSMTPPPSDFDHF